MNADSFLRTINLLETLLLSRLDSFSKTQIPIHFSLPLPSLEVELIDLLNTCAIDDTIYFKSHNDESETITFGTNIKFSTELSDLEECFSKVSSLNNNPLSRFYSIIAFNKNDSAKDLVWSNLNESIFIQPFIEIVKKKNHEMIMYVHHSSKNTLFTEYIKTFFEQLKQTININSENTNTSFKLTQMPEKDNWKKNLTKAIKKMKTGSLQKVVLSRKTIATFKQSINGSKLMKRFYKKEQNCSVFYYQQRQDSIFFSITPEKLYLRQKDYIEVDAIAGTRSISDNGFYAGELLSSTKDHLEHELVIQGIIHNLHHVSKDVKIKYKHQLVKLSKIQHLKTLITATLTKENDDYQIIKHLQPTAAICGTPRKKAQMFIAEIEQFNRGFYTGVAGLISKEHSEFLVLIRSCLIKANNAHFYVGAGIVEESNPDDEWDELNSKQANYMEILHEYYNI